ncbi:hypothetical protein HC931_01830 [Candidatus Gracilibacteria bacterium]|nr:hypothetical protein [Candidatus Gracilibacteria bacterium]
MYYKLVDLTNRNTQAEAIAWGDNLTSTGDIVNPLEFVHHGGQNLMESPTQLPIPDRQSPISNHKID